MGALFFGHPWSCAGTFCKPKNILMPSMPSNHIQSIAVNSLQHRPKSLASRPSALEDARGWVVGLDYEADPPTIDA